MKKFLITIKILQNFFHFHQKLIKENQCLKTIVGRNIEESVKLKRRRISEIEEEEKTSNEFCKKYFTDYQSLSDMCKKLREAEGKKNEDQVYLIKKVLNKMKKKTLKR